MKQLLIICSILFACIVPAFAQGVPQAMSYQGYVTDLTGTPVADGNYDFTFTIYTSEVAGAAIWSETHPSVQVSKGLFTAMLGRGNPPMPFTIAFDQQYYLGIRIGTDPELAPRVRLGTTAYSFRAKMADNIPAGLITDAHVSPTAAIAASKLQSSILTEGEIVAGSGVTISNAGGTLTIAASPGAVTLAGDVAGPAASNAIANNAVTSAKIADLAVGTAKIANDAVTAAKIAPDVVSSINNVKNDGGNIDLVAGANVTITPNDAGNSITIAAAGGGGGLTLPYSGSATSSSDAFSVTQAGTARVGYFAVTNTTTSSDAFRVQTSSTNSNSDAVSAFATGGNAIEAVNNSATQPTFYAYNSGSGPVATFGNSSTSTGDIVRITKNGGTGKALSVNYTGTTNAVYIENNSSGTGLELKQDGTGKAAYFHIENAASTENALYAETKGTAVASDAIQAKAAGGRAFYGESACASGFNTTYSKNTGTGGALFAQNTSATNAAVSFSNTTSTANSRIMSLGGSTGEVTTVDREGDIETDGNITADFTVATTALGASATPADGSLYKDNIVYGWANVSSTGSLMGGDEGFGVTTSKTATGTYVITYKNSLTGGAAPMAIALEASAPQFAVISAASSTGCTVKIWRFSAGAFALTDSVFYFMLAGRP